MNESRKKKTVPTDDEIAEQHRQRHREEKQGKTFKPPTVIGGGNK